MELSQPENGLVIEKMTLTKPHDVTELESQVCYNGTVKDAIKYDNASHSSVDSESFQSRQNSLHHLCPVTPSSDDNAVDNLENGVEDDVELDCVRNSGEGNHFFTTNNNCENLDEVASAGCGSSIHLKKYGSVIQEKQPLMKDNEQEKISLLQHQASICELTDKKDSTSKSDDDVVDSPLDEEKKMKENLPCAEGKYVHEADKNYTTFNDVNKDNKNEDCCDKKKGPERLINDIKSEEDPLKPDCKGFSEIPHDIPPQVFEDITEDEDEEDETYENIELELDDLIDPAELSRSSVDSERGKCDTQFLDEDSLIKQAKENDSSLLIEPDARHISLEQETTIGSTQNSDKMAVSASVSDPNLIIDVTKAANNIDSQKSCSTVIMVPEGQLEKKTNIYTILSSTSSFKTVTSDKCENDHVQKQKFTARKSGKPINQIDSMGLKTINLHPIKNITMKLSDVQGALDCDVLRDSGSTKFKVSESNISATDTDSNGTLIPLEVNSGKAMTALKKKRRKNTYDFPGCKKKPKRTRSDELESIGSSADSFSSDGDFLEVDLQKGFVSHTDTSTSTPKLDLVHDSLLKNTLLNFPKKSKSSSLSSSPMPSPVTTSSALSYTSPKPAFAKTNSKMKSVLDMLHARSQQKAEMEEKKAASNTVQTVSVTTSATSTTTTVLVSPPPNKQIVEGVKRKGTPRKRRDDVICLSDSEDSGEELVVEGKRKRDSTYNNSPAVSAPHSQLSKQKLATSVTQAPVVMVVAQHSSAPGLRSLLPRQALASPTGSATGQIVQPPPGSFPLISTLPVGAKTISLANLPPGVAAVPVTSLPPGSQPAVTYFTAVPASMATAMPIPISGANYVNITSPVQFLNNASPGKSTRPTSSESLVSTSFSTTKTSSASTHHSNSDSLRALLGGKPYTFSRANSSQLSSTPMLFQMVTATGANMVQIPAQTMTLTTASVPGMLKPSYTMPVSKSTYSLLKPHLPVVPNGLSCLTPPKTPETDSSSEFAVAASLSRPVAGQVEDSEVIPLCCCKINGATFKKLFTGVTYCQALDTVDNKILGCYNKVTNPQLIRPGVKIPFMVVCETHRKRLKLHQCCPGCGHFCTQGKFQQCRKDGQSSVHNFHKQCVFYRGGKYYCPHCGEETNQSEVELQLNEENPEETKLVLPRLIKREFEKRTARIHYKNFTKSKSASEPKVETVTLPNNKVINIEALPLGPDQQTLTRLCRCVSEDRPKKYRTLPKDLYTPASEGDVEKVFYLLVDGMDPNEKYDAYDDQTALHAAATSGSVGVVFILTQFGAEIHALDKSLKTPVMCAAENGNLKAVQLLIKAGAKLEDRGEDGMTSLHFAAKAGYIDIVQHILETEKVDVNIQDDGGWTAIMWATELQMPEVVKYLLAQGGDPNKKDNEENTSLHWAAFSGSLTIAEMFLDRGCEVDAVNEHGDRPLHIAARQDHYDMVVLLLSRGADVNTRNNKNESPLDSCTNKSGQVWMALKVNQQLRGFAAGKIIRPEHLVERDITMGREKNPVACVNSEDNEPCPMDYLYVTENVETSPLNINYVITSLQSCRCKDDCSSMYCVCGRSSIKCWYDKMGRLLDELNLLEPPLVFECNRACRCWVNCNNRVVQNGITCRLQMFKTNGRGWGVRALMDITKGTFVCEYIGELISDSEADRREDDSYLFDLDNKDGDTYCIDARKYGNISRFINHLCEPNLVPVKVFVEHQDLRFPRICLFSSRDIKAYEELGFDYGEKFWMIKWKHFTCACKSLKCKYSSETIKKTLADYKLRYPDENVDI